MKMRRLIALLMAALMLVTLLTGCDMEDIRSAIELASDVAEIIEEIDSAGSLTGSEAEPEPDGIDEYGSYSSKEDVALYIYTYGRLPDNFVTKDEARAAGWSGGGLEKHLPGMCIGGDRFGNREGLLPEAKGRFWTECDIDTLGESSRGAKRIVFSNDGLIYYTDDHYESFELLYGNP